MSKSQHLIRKIDVACVPVKSVSEVSSSDVVSAIRPGKTILVTLMITNNESVNIHPVAKVAAH